MRTPPATPQVRRRETCNILRSAPQTRKRPASARRRVAKARLRPRRPASNRAKRTERGRQHMPIGSRTCTLGESTVLYRLSRRRTWRTIFAFAQGTRRPDRRLWLDGGLSNRPFRARTRVVVRCMLRRTAFQQSWWWRRAGFTCLERGLETVPHTSSSSLRRDMARDA